MNRHFVLTTLVITIVVLIILAAVAINLSLGNNGIFNRAKTAKEQYQNAESYEKNATNEISDDIDRKVNSNRAGVTLSQEEYDGLQQTITTLSNKVDTLVAEKCKAGIINVSALNAKSGTTVNVTFTTPFADTNYSVTVTEAANGSYWADIIYCVTNKTANGFSISAYNNHATSSSSNNTRAAHTAYWIATPYNS